MSSRQRAGRAGQRARPLAGRREGHPKGATDGHPPHRGRAEPNALRRELRAIGIDCEADVDEDDFDATLVPEGIPIRVDAGDERGQSVMVYADGATRARGGTTSRTVGACSRGRMVHASKARGRP